MSPICLTCPCLDTVRTRVAKSGFTDFILFIAWWPSRKILPRHGQLSTSLTCWKSTATRDFPGSGRIRRVWQAAQPAVIKVCSVGKNCREFTHETFVGGAGWMCKLHNIYDAVCVSGQSTTTAVTRNKTWHTKFKALTKCRNMAL